MPENDGLKLSLIFPGGPSAMSGLKIGDVIVGMDDREVRDYPTLLALLMNRKPGDMVILKVRRGEQYLTVPVALGKR
jgi:S1-C subfamily serine protease